MTPRVPAHLRRSRCLSIYLTTPEYERLKFCADETGQRQQDFVRESIARECETIEKRLVRAEIYSELEMIERRRARRDEGRTT